MTNEDNMPGIEIAPTPEVNNFLYWLAGAAILPLNKLRHTLQGYTTPRTFGITEFERAVEYDFSVVKSWRYYLDYYMGQPTSLKDRTILELGPGADLGVALLLTMLGARKYNSLDVNNLVQSVPDELYETFFAYASKVENPETTIDELKKQLDLTRQGKNDKINYICDPSFNLNQFKDEGVDLVFSQAAFEHFDDIPKTFSQLTEIVKPGCVLIAEIDLTTHTRWIRDVDPNNIYRYPEWYYKACKFLGAPNRLRPYQYKDILEELGWSNVKIIPRVCLSSSHMEQIEGKLASKFNDPVNHMEQLSVILCATR